MPFLILLNASVAVDGASDLVFGISAARQWGLRNNLHDHSHSLWDGLVQDRWVHHTKMYFKSMVRNFNFLWESRGMNSLQSCCCSVAQSCPALCEPMDWEVSFIGLRLLFAGKQIIYLFWMIFNYLWWPYTCAHSVAKLCLTLFDPMDCSPPGFSVHGIFQARTLQWDAISFSRGSSWPGGLNPGLLHCRQILSHWTTWEFPIIIIVWVIVLIFIFF